MPPSLDLARSLRGVTYNILRDVWRSASGAYGSHCDQSSGTGVGGGRWYRFSGTGGDALPLTTPGHDMCGTRSAGWLAGWGDATDPPNMYSEVGWYPAAEEGVVEMTVCFDNNGQHCYAHVQVEVVRCSSFLLWRLPDTPTCTMAYCTVPSGI